jgi:hypothetical protein
MLKHSLVVAAALALGMSSAYAEGGCSSYQKTVQTPAPVATAAPVQTPVPSEPVKQDVASVEVQKPETPKTN